MKKIICALLSVVIALSLTACVSYSAYDNAFNGKLEVKTEFEAYGRSTKQIKYTVTNVSEDEQHIGLYEYLAKKVDGHWKLVEPISGEWQDLGYIFAAGESHTYTFDLDDYYKLPLAAGEYKLVLLNTAESNIFKVE